MEAADFSPSFETGFFYPTSKIFNKASTGKEKISDEENNNDTDSATALSLIRKGDRTRNKIAGKKSDNNQMTLPARSPVYPTLPSSTSVLHDVSEVTYHNDSESMYIYINKHFANSCVPELCFVT